jgi:hypothetical protein
MAWDSSERSAPPTSDILWPPSVLYCRPVVHGVWQITLGPLAYVVVCKTPSTKLRSKTIALATVIDAITGLATTVVGPYLLNPGAANAGGEMEFLYGGISVFSLTWCIFRLPETKGRTFEEFDIMFERKVAARAFAKYVPQNQERALNLSILIVSGLGEFPRVESNSRIMTMQLQ